MLVHLGSGVYARAMSQQVWRLHTLCFLTSFLCLRCFASAALLLMPPRDGLLHDLLNLTASTWLPGSKARTRVDCGGL